MTLRRSSPRHIRLLGAALLGASLSAVALVGPALSSPARPASQPPSTVTAFQLASSDSPPFARRGKVISQSHLLTVRMFVSAKNGFALANFKQAQYPAATIDGGKTWSIDGPHFHVNAANAPDAVLDVGAFRPSTYVSYGGPGGGQTVVVSTDRGKHWWRAIFQGTPVAVALSHVGGSGKLVVLVENFSATQVWVYLSSDGGHTWHHHTGAF